MSLSESLNARLFLGPGVFSRQQTSFLFCASFFKKEIKSAFGLICCKESKVAGEEELAEFAHLGS